MLLSLRRLKEKPFINDEENRISITSLNLFICSFVPSNLQFEEEVRQTNIFGLEVLLASFQAEAHAIYVFPLPVAPVMNRFLCSVMYSQVASLFISSRLSFLPDV